MDNTNQTILETIGLHHQNDLKHFAELLKTKVITFEQYSELYEKSQKNYNELFEKIQNTLREDMKLYYQTKEKIAAIQYKPRSFGDILCDTTNNIARGLEVLSATSNEPIQKSKFSE
jgi:hypothetical protein